MPALDTNVLVRWLVADDEAQTDQAQALFKSVRSRAAAFFVPCTVMLELEWVLRSRYRFEKPAILQAFNALLETQELEFQDEAAIEWALHFYRQSTADFADCLHAGICGAANRSPLLSFDRKAGRLPNVALLGG